MEKWFVQTKKADFEDWSRRLGIDVVTARILRNRDIETAEEAKSFLGGSLSCMHDPFLMKDMDKAVQVIIDAVGKGKKIRVIGDYDVDGVTSAYILTKGFNAIGADVSTAIPHRVKDGYGLNDQLVKDAAEDGVGLIVTCDNGISALTQVDLANSLGVEVVVTDHHEVPFEEDENGKHIQMLPRALAVVNPKRYDCDYPFKGICGAMVAYKLMRALFTTLGDGTGDDIKEELLLFASLGTVCDVMELKDENRIAVKEGLKLMARTENYGLKALMEVNSLDTSKLSAYSFGFVIGPCINASGRLDTALRAFELLNSSSMDEALIAARELKELNDSRKNLTNEGIETAERFIADNSLDKKAVWLIYLPDVHESIAGIIAGKIKEKYCHPVIVLTKSEEMLKGSGRSIEGYHMQESLMKAAPLLEKFGGHALTAGLSLKEEKLTELDSFLNANASLSDDDFVKKVMIDVPMPTGYASMKLAKEIESLEPFGTGNPSPLFAEKDLEFIGMKRFGADGKYARYAAKGSRGNMVEFTSFEKPEIFLAFLDEKYGEGSGASFENGKGSFKISVVYSLVINRFRGNESLQFMMKYYC